ncbi:MAG TPA: uroporphyrinogen-III C-methyltransferase [Candidatus Acidoferrales bacterium]|nr:uroporphyrinogen-III C-methyltransferase [Candidatus Acidoferrales bacterium]
MAGKIYLVGAGPGDPGLLTIKGRQALQQADLVVYDYLANQRLLEYTRPGVEHRLVGKHGGGRRVEQDIINRMLIDEAGRGKIVTRLKGGDPFIFGRGGEEAEAAANAGIDFEIVPGVSSAIAVPAYAGIPLTHRDCASNVVFTTGYEDATKPELAVRWEELGRKGSTLVILMTQRQLRGNMQKLIAAGRAPETPAAVVSWGTRAAQKTVVGCIANLAELAEAAGIHPPALAVVGEVVRLRERLKWLERKPLFGRRIVVTRPRAQASAFAERLESFGAEVVPFPTIETVPPASFDELDAALQRAKEFNWVVFTSVNGVRAFFERLLALDLDIRDWSGARFAAIGPQTARALRERGVRLTLVPPEFRAEGLLKAFSEIGVKQQRILLPRAAGAREILPQQLHEAGALVEEVISYRSVVPSDAADAARADLIAGGADLLTFTSSSTVHNFVTLCGSQLNDIAKQSLIGCIGPITADTARSYGMEVHIQPASYTIEAFAEAIVQFFARDDRPRSASGGS